MMYAVIQSGGKQHRVQPGQVIQLEKLPGEVGSKTVFDQVLMVAKPGTDSTQIWLGKPTLGTAQVEGQIIGQGRGDKIIIVKMKRRKQYRRTQGHRQDYTQVLITNLNNGSGETLALSAQETEAKTKSFFSLLKPRNSAPKTKITKKAASAKKAS